MKRFLTLLLLSIVMFGALTCPPTTVVAQEEQGYSSSTNSADVAVVESRSYDLRNGTITFSEYPLDTAISNQYASQGIIFGGDSPFISTDSANPTSPVLSGTP